MAGETKVKTIDQLPYVTLPMTGNEHIPIVQGGQAKRMHPGDFPAVLDGYVRLDGTTPFQKSQSMDGHKLTDLGAPENDNDGVRFRDLEARTGWVKVIPLAEKPESWEPESLYLIAKNGYIIPYLTDDEGEPANIGNTEKVVNSVNDETGAITVGVKLTGGKLSVQIGSNEEINLDARYLQIANYTAPDSIPNDIEDDRTGAATAVIADTTTLYIVNPDAIVAAMTRQLPAEPAAGQIVRIKFGGEIETGTVVTAFTLTCDEEHEIVLNPAESAIEVGVEDVFVFQFFGDKWFRLDKEVGKNGDFIEGVGTKKITVASTPPAGMQVGDIYIEII